MENQKKACCVFGHREITGKDELKIKLREVIENLIVCENVDTFYLGSKSQFDSLCCEVLAEEKKKYPHIERVYVRGEFPDINDNYEKYLLEGCERTYFPQKARNSGRAVYVIRNCEMIDNSDICLVYFKSDYKKPKSGTEIAYKYALRKKRKIINLA